MHGPSPYLKFFWGPSPQSLGVSVPACTLLPHSQQMKTQTRENIYSTSFNQTRSCVTLWRSLELSTDIESAVSFQATRAGRQCPVDRLSVIGRTSSRASVSLS